MRITVTPAWQTAYKTIEQGHNLLILGSAGTGKSTFLKWLKQNLADQKKMAVVAPTGMAALQAGGQTIHSFFGFKPQLMQGTPDDWRKPRTPKFFQNLELLVIDEISMVRADILTTIDQFLQKYGPLPGNPFGGVQIVALGDLFQLPPVVRRDEMDLFDALYPTPFFFGSQSWHNFRVLEFPDIFRQQDATFIELLNSIRQGERRLDVLATLNERVTSEPPAAAVKLAARNQTVHNMNQAELTALSAKPTTYEASTTGKIDENALLTPARLTLKPQARVMFTRNDPQGRWVNGTAGVVQACGDKRIDVQLNSGKLVVVEPIKWEWTKYELDSATESPKASTTGTFTQFPLTLAWAMTIHKAQGQTLDAAYLDLSDGGIFTEGQLYVALSRVRRLQDLTLRQPITPADVRISPTLVQFYEGLRAA